MRKVYFVIIILVMIMFTCCISILSASFSSDAKESEISALCIEYADIFKTLREQQKELESLKTRRIKTLEKNIKHLKQQLKTKIETLEIK